MTHPPDTAEMAPAADLVLLERARARDRGAWQALMQRYNQRLFRIARSVAVSAEAAAERVQDAYLHAIAGLPHFEPGEKPGTWLARITYGQAVSAQRQALRASLQEAATAGRAAGGAAPAEAPDTRSLERAIDELPDVFRTVFVLRVLEGVSGTETAACLGINETTVRTRLYRALRRLPADVAKRMDAERHAVFELEAALGERIIQAVLARLER